MFKNLTLRTKLLTLGISLTVIPFVVVVLAICRQNKLMNTATREGCTKLAYESLDHTAQNVYDLCTTHQDALRNQVTTSLRVASTRLKAQGEITFSPDRAISWNALNQLTGKAAEVSLPVMRLGDTELVPVLDAQIEAYFVDDVSRIVGGTCTLFQRMDSEGNMLRVATNVIGKDGKRAVGTYIPALDPEGRVSPVIATVLKGERYVGRALVVDKWCATAYEPILDAGKNVVGMLYYGIPESTSTALLRKAIMDIKVGKTGYVFVLNGNGTSKGNYVISKDGKRDGENIWDAKDEKGNLFVQDICTKALALAPGQIGEQHYPWKNSGDVAARSKIVRIMYFQPWDWIIGVGCYEDDFYDAANSVAAIGHRGLILQMSVASAVVLLSVAVWFFVARGLTRKIGTVTELLSSGVGQTTAAAGEISSASQSLAEGASEQAASLEETSASLEEMSSMTKRNADNAQNAKDLATGTRHAADTGFADMQAMSDAMNAIKASSDGISKIIKTIDEIAFQTNILALNAAVEAARAGEAGMGFAVVADEVRNLAQRSAEAAKETAAKIEDSIQKSENGVQISAKVAQGLQEIVSKVRQVDELVAQIATASKEQSLGIEQVNTAVSQMDKVTQANAASAEESASAAEELNAQAVTLNGIVADLQRLVGGANAHVVSTVPETRHVHKSPVQRIIKPTSVRQTKPVAHQAVASISASDVRHSAYDAQEL